MTLMLHREQCGPFHTRYKFTYMRIKTAHTGNFIHTQMHTHRHIHKHTHTHTKPQTHINAHARLQGKREAPPRVELESSALKAAVLTATPRSPYLLSRKIIILINTFPFWPTMWSYYPNHTKIIQQK